MPMYPGLGGFLGGEPRHRRGVRVGDRHHDSKRQVGLGDDRIDGF